MPPTATLFALVAVMVTKASCLKAAPRATRRSNISSRLCESTFLDLYEWFSETDRRQVRFHLPVVFRLTGQLSQLKWAVFRCSGLDGDATRAVLSSYGLWLCHIKQVFVFTFQLTTQKDNQLSELRQLADALFMGSILGKKTRTLVCSSSTGLLYLKWFDLCTK